MLKKAGMIAGVAAGLMIVGSPAFAGTSTDLVMHDGGDTQVTHYVPIQIVDNHVPVSSEEYVDGGASHTNASNVLGGGGDLQETDYLPIQFAGNTLPISSYLEYLGSNADNSSNTAG
ncbi:hypothetical protein [Kutzneria buriramensis]|uniref:WxL domain-containing protein n=1 Tax=Kutzneria buriramensis TaxID=1045776 RepID=A0A3E0HZG5_9PSEU|nr:hypothetical protein [Kutzneria buriramensis]REH51771.1 hypothetical protein BCF44_103220 [Kutzneria buriramensis]